MDNDEIYFKTLLDKIEQLSRENERHKLTITKLKNRSQRTDEMLDIVKSDIEDVCNRFKNIVGR